MKIHKARRDENFSGTEQNKRFLRALPAGRISHFTSKIYPSLDSTRETTSGTRVWRIFRILTGEDIDNVISRFTLFAPSLPNASRKMARDRFVKFTEADIKQFTGEQPKC